MTVSANKCKKSTCTTRTQLIEAGLEELITQGYLNFSTRRVAKKCGVSCAAPYKHFEDTDAFITAIMEYISNLYCEIINQILVEHKDQPADKQLIAIAMGYIHFAVTYPDYYSISNRIPQNHPASKFAISSLFSTLVKSLADQFFQEHPDCAAKREQILFMTRSIVYGATVLFSNHQLEYTEENRKMIRQLLFREASL